MIINLKESELFTITPATRFARAYDLSPKVWDELWKCYAVRGDSYEALAALLYYKTGKKVIPKTMQRWVMRTKIYAKALPAIEKGAHIVHSYHFDELENDVIRELTQNLKRGKSKEPRAIV